MVSIYILRCECNKYYVGKTTSHNINKRLNAHFSGQGSQWTRLYHPLEVIEIISNCEDEDEDKYTKKMMKLHGIENVRGGAYSRVSLGNDEIYFLKREMYGNKNNCFKCGQAGHFVKDCPLHYQNNTYFVPDISNNITNIVPYCIQNWLSKNKIFIHMVYYEQGKTILKTNSFGITKLRELPYIQINQKRYNVISTSRNINIFAQNNVVYLDGIHREIKQGWYEISVSTIEDSTDTLRLLP
jgi:predicted GIY-YIG superfamily endonuclease